MPGREYPGAPGDPGSGELRPPSKHPQRRESGSSGGRILGEGIPIFAPHLATVDDLGPDPLQMLHSGGVDVTILHRGVIF